VLHLPFLPGFFQLKTKSEILVSHNLKILINKVLNAPTSNWFSGEKRKEMQSIMVLAWFARPILFFVK